MVFFNVKILLLINGLFFGKEKTSCLHSVHYLRVFFCFLATIDVTFSYDSYYKKSTTFVIFKVKLYKE